MSDFGDRAKLKAEQMAKKASRVRTAEMLKRRMEYAKEGTIYYKAGKYREANERYLKYLQIVEEWKGVKAGTLHPSQFDPKRDAGEMILMAGIFWDMAKLYDRSKAKAKGGVDPMKNYLDLYVLFSKGMPYQSLCAETIRKYLLNDKAVHRGAFKDAYTALGGGRCFIVGAVGEYTDVATLGILRGYRDDELSSHAFGRFLIRVYYSVGPLAAVAVKRVPIFAQKKLAKIFNRMAQKILF